MPRIVDVNAETGEVFITELPDDAEVSILPEPIEEPVAEEVPPIE